MSNISASREMLIVSLLAAVFVIIGLGLICTGVHFYRQVAQIRAAGVKTRGTIVRY